MKKNKLAAKVLFSGGLLLAAVHGANRLVNTIAGIELSKHKTSVKDIYNYKCQYGNVRYIKKGNGAPLLLLHGLNSSLGIAEWDKNIETLSKNYTVYALEFLGFGYSDKPKLSYSAYLFTSLINDFIRDVIKDKTYVAASGTASGICLAAAILQPGYFKKIILISPTGVGTMNLPAKNHVKKFLETPVIGTAVYNIFNSRFAANYLLKTIYFDKNSITNDFLTQHYLTAHYNAPGAKYSYAASMSNFFGVDLERLIKKADVPVHVVWGDSNILNPISNYKNLLTDNDNNDNQTNDLSITIFENSKQYPHHDNPQSFKKVCRWFFKD